MNAASHLIVVDQSPKLALKELKEFHAPELFDCIEKNRARLRKFLPWLDSNTSLEHTERFIRLTKDLNRRALALGLGIFYDDKICGVCGFNRIDRENKSAVIGYWLDEAHEGKGLMSLSVMGLIDRGFDEMGFHRMELRVAPGNERSRKVPNRLGFEKEGLMRDAEWLYDHFVDHELYSLLKSEWPEKRRRYLNQHQNPQ